MVREYIGARYVPKFMGTHDLTQIYEALCVVDNGLGTSYISKIPTPAGTPLTDTTYWAIYGAGSGAVINLQNQIDDIVNNQLPPITSDITDLQNDVDDINNTKLPAITSDITDLQNDVDDINNTKLPAITSDIADLQTAIDADIYAHLKNKKILIVGDSLSDESVQAPNWVANLRTKCADLGTQIDNLSVGGGGWCSTTIGSGGLIDQLANVTDIYDYVILFAGINDFNSQFPVGSVGSNNRTTFCGALYELHSVLHTKCPSAVVFYCTSPHTTIWTQAQKPIPHNRYRSRAYKACQRFGWLMIDTTNLPNYNLMDYASGISDGIHPTPAYAPYLCDHIVKAINAGGETPALCINRYKVAFDSPYTSNLYIDFRNDGLCELVFVLSDSIPTGNQTVVSSPDGGYTDGTTIIIPTTAGNIGLFMWANQIIVNIPSGLGNGYNKTRFFDGDNYDIPNCY